MNEAHFWSRVERTETCWLWTGARFRSGYGHIKVDGRHLSTHRVAFELHHGPIPDSLYVCHRCDVRHCVRPDHLFLGTARQNSQDAVAKGRVPRGERHYDARLTEEDVADIRREYRPGRGAVAALARQYGVSHGTMRQVVQRTSWRDVHATP